MTQAESKNFCDSIQLSEFNKIQAHGCMLILNKKLRVIQYSENIENIMDTSIEQLLNSPVTSFLEPEDLKENIANWIKEINNKYKPLPYQYFKIDSFKIFQ